MTPNPTAAPPSVSRSPLRAALEEANIPSLLMAVYQLTGDDRWLGSRYHPVRPPGLDDNDSGGLSPEAQSEIRDAAADAVEEFQAGLLVPRDLSPTELTSALSIALDDYVPEEYGPLIAEEFGASSRDVTIDKPATGFSVAIIGAGLSGICAAIKLKAAGVPFTVIEKNADIGGTWLENTYPGCGVDTPGHLYCFSFDPNIEWTRYFAKRDEVWAYLRRLADEYGIVDNIQFATEIDSADFDETTGRWTLIGHSTDGSTVQFDANVLVPAVGMVNRPSFPKITGIDSFGGPTMHSAQWDSTVDLTGKRVAVIGNGASAMQLVPAIAGTAGKVTVFQRSKQWAMPHPNYHREVSEAVRQIMREVPFYAQWYRLRAFWNFSDRLHEQVQVDPEWPHLDRSVNASNERHRIFLTKYITDQLADRADLLDACIPDYPPYGKRPLIDNGWYKTIQRDDVELISHDVAEIREGSVVTSDGREYDADVLVFATGFRALQFLWPMDIRGRSRRTLAEVWGHNDARAYLGLTVPDFPNMFILNGPNTNAGHGGSAVIATELQVRYLMQAVNALVSGDAQSLEVRDDVFWDYNNELDDALTRSIWAHPGMTNWYRNEAGRVVISSPWKYLDYWERTRTLNLDDFRKESGSEVQSVD